MKFTVSAHQEMFAHEQIEANTLREAIEKFKAKLRNDEVVWRPSDEDMDFTISEEDDMGNVVSEIDNEELGVLIRV